MERYQSPAWSSYWTTLTPTTSRLECIALSECGHNGHRCVISHSIPRPFPPTSLPPFSPPLHSHHTPHGHVTNTLPNLAFVLLYITVWICFPIAIVRFFLPLPQRSETHLVKTPFPAYHTYSVIKVTELSSQIEYKCRWATDGFRRCVNHGKTPPKTIQKG